MTRVAECPRCRQLLPVHEFDVVLSDGRRRRRECKVCRHQRLSKKHEREAAKLLEARRRRRGNDQERAEAARSVAGRD